MMKELSKMMTSPDIILAQFGYIYTGSCRCDGRFTKKYHKPGTNYKIRYRPVKMSFKIIAGNAPHTDWKNIRDLEPILNELATQTIQTQTKV